MFQKCIPEPVTLYAKPKLSKRTVAERVKICIAIVEERNQENSLFLVQKGNQFIS
jgi:hypothetical protein